MAKHNKKQSNLTTEDADELLLTEQKQVSEKQEQTSQNQQDKKGEDVAAEKNATDVIDNVDQQINNDANTDTQKKQRSGGTAVALLALLIALGIGGTGYFVGQKKFSETEQHLIKIQQQLTVLDKNNSANVINTEMPTFDAEKAQITKLASENQKSFEQISQLERQQASYDQQIALLQAQLQKLGSMPKAEPTVWLLSDADFLLTNALRKIVIDYDIETAKSLLMEADNVLNQVSDPQIIPVREALKSDLNNLMSLNQVDQNNVMQRLGQLANLVDEMPMLDNEQLATKESGEVSESVEDWQKNLEKSADSFLSHFIRISDKKQVQEKAFIAPNQEIYLRENIRLRLQIAILAVPRQQNELYKQSLEAVSSWVRSYFDVQSEVVKNFLKEIDELVDQSIYIDAPTKLQSLELLKQKLNRRLPTVEKIELGIGKDVEQLKIEQTAEPTPDVKPANTNVQ